MTKRRTAWAAATLAALGLLGACSDDGGSTSSTDPVASAAPADPTTTPAPATIPTTVAPTTTLVGVDGYTWTQVVDGAPWGGRAGLRALEQDGALFVMGGRTPRDSPIPGDSELWGDVWRSDDGGESWTRVVETGAAFPARAYFQAIDHDGAMFVVGGQDFAFPASTFFNDVWRSPDGVTWEQATAAAPWQGRAGLMAASFGGELYVFGGSRNDDSAVVGPAGPAREYFNDVWRSPDGVTWEQVTAAAPWSPRAGGAVVVHDGALYLLGGEVGFVCSPQPDCEPPYFNDVWRTDDGETWEQVTPAAAWSPRPGHQCESLEGLIVCFGGFGQAANPIDMWESTDGATWTPIDSAPWNATQPSEGRYDFDSLVVADGPGGRAAIFTFGGDRETFDFGDPENYRRVDDDVWAFGAPVS